MNRSALLLAPLGILLSLVFLGALQPDRTRQQADIFQKPSTSETPHQDEFPLGWVELERRSQGEPRSMTPRARNSRLVPAGTNSAAPLEIQDEVPSHSHTPLQVPPEFVGLSTDEFIARLPEEQGKALARYRDELATFDPEFRRYICWASGTAPELIAAYRQVEQEAGLAPGSVQTMANQFLGSGHWSTTATNGFGNSQQGLPTTVTWSIVPDGTLAPGLDGGTSTSSNLRSWLAGLYGGSSSAAASAQPWFHLFEEAMEQLSEQNGLNLVYEPNDDGGALSNAFSKRGVLGTRGDIRISGRAIDGSNSVLAFAFAPDYGDLVIDTTDTYFNSKASNSVRLLNVLAHELGHAVGLDHVCPTNGTKLMEPYINTSFRGSQFDEIQSLQRQYGDSLEAHGSQRNNDSAAKATPLAPTTGVLSSWEWLGIDDNNDQDWFAISADRNAKLTARIIPADERYAEGAESSISGCGSGSTFDASTQHNLSLEIRDSNGSSILASSTGASVGETEEIPAFSLPDTATYYVRVNGDTSNAAQLYRMELLLESAPPSVDLQVLQTRIDAESNAGKNANIDPGETVRLAITIANQGLLPAEGLSAELTGPSGFTSFGITQPPSQLAAGTQTEILCTFALEGECGDELELSLQLLSNSGPTTLTLPVVLGSSMGTTQTEDFDATSGLPADWTSTTSGNGVNWTPTNSRSDTAPQSLFSPSVTSSSEALLTSPPITLGPNGGTLSFRHQYELENRYDGAVLEASLNGDEDWFDLLSSQALVVSGNYNSSIRRSANSAISGRLAWTGAADTFITTSIELPAEWAGDSIRFRWRLVHDVSDKSDGWWVDSYSVETEATGCDLFRPILSLTAPDAYLSERQPESAVTLQLSTPLPLTQDIRVPLLIRGNASAADLASAPEILLPAGKTSVQYDLLPHIDDLIEGTETLILSINPEAENHAPGDPAEVTILIDDSAYGAWAAAGIAPRNPLASPDQDPDGDGWSNLAEYLLDTEPGTASSQPTMKAVASGTHLEVIIGEVAGREDAQLGAEASSDLIDWSTEGVIRTESGFSISQTGDQGFLRLTFELK